MTFPTYRTIRPFLALLLAFLTACAANAPPLGQEKKVAEQNGGDNSKMGATAPWRNTSMRISRKAS
jgi:hypothetical protein